jgi:hypothetical protein
MVASAQRFGKPAPLLARELRRIRGLLGPAGEPTVA